MEEQIVNRRVADRSKDVELANQQKSIDKLERVVEKIAENTITMNKMVAVHEEKINNFEEQHKSLVQEVKNVTSKVDESDKKITKNVTDLETKISDEHKDKFDDLEKRISTIEQWKWFVVGIAGAVGYYLEHMNVFSTKP
jgi:predicted RNase H-like nuclease (RuvC/YqgF family)